VADRRQQFQTLSMDWHQFLGFQAEREHEKGYRKRKRALFKSEANKARVNQ
jgi:hypothetical protein